MTAAPSLPYERPQISAGVTASRHSHLERDDRIDPSVANQTPVSPVRRLPFGCITGHAKSVEISLAKAALSGRARQLLQLIHVRSFGDAGYHQTEPGLWCEFSLADWAKELGMQRQNLWRLRSQLVEQRVISYQSADNDPTRGIVHWNLNFHEWLVLDNDYRCARYTRAGAGRKPATAPRESNGLHLVPLTDQNTDESNGLQEGSDLGIKVITVGCSEPAAVQDTVATLRKVTKNGRKNGDADASRAARANSVNPTKATRRNDGNLLDAAHGRGRRSDWPAALGGL